MRASTVVPLLLALLLAACGRPPADSTADESAAGPVAPSLPDLHEPFDTLLAANVVDGMVDYGAFENAPQFKQYLQRLESIDPETLAGDSERMAYYINGYNALVIAGVVKSNRDGFYHGVADQGGSEEESLTRFFKTTQRPLATGKASLEELRDTILVKQFGDPRVHAALSCGSLSCPMLESAAWPPEEVELEARLEDAMERFVRDPVRNKISSQPPAVRLSRLFEWQAADFGADETALRTYLAAYLDEAERKVVMDPRVPVEYIAYDWSLNSR